MTNLSRRHFVGAALMTGVAAHLIGEIPEAAAATLTDLSPQLIYSPDAGTSFNPEGGRAAGTTYAKTIILKNSGSSNGTALVTYDQLVLENGVQVYPIYRRLAGSDQWTRIATITPSQQFPSLTRTAQPFLYEVPPGTAGITAGTLLFAGMIMPEDRSSSTLVLYSSVDHGMSWTYLSTIDAGGPATYDPSPSSTTTTVWEPSLAVDAQGGLVAYYSDERQKKDGVLQAVVYRRSLDGGKTWGELVNVSAPNNRSDRPGMITVTRMANGKYIAVYEVVNRPSRTQNNAVIYYQISEDGLTWQERSIGTKIELADGRGIGSSPFVRWVPEGGPEGMVVVASKWALDAEGNIDGGQNYYVNRASGQGTWERLPYGATYDASDTAGGTFSGFAQALDYDPSTRTLWQATNVENLTTGYNDIVMAPTPLNAVVYEADLAACSNTRLVTHGDASNGSKIGDINESTSTVTFAVTAPQDGTYSLDVRYDNGTGAPSSHQLSVNGTRIGTIRYAATHDWGRFGWASTTVTLRSGLNTIVFSKGTSYAEIDLIRVRASEVDMPLNLRLLNRGSGKYLEIPSEQTANGVGAVQWERTSSQTQVWNLAAEAGGVFTLRNVNSGLLLEIPAAQTASGVQAVQWADTGHATQRWAMTSDDDWFRVVNSHSGLTLEVASGSTENGAAVQQWQANTYPCQQWRLSVEGAQ
ncbi:RICIN domain-containing protein [Actinomyces sp. MRS3W]|uniref:RICIN domain-containing protein n=1 Tax=Actinomyces sp. MRS3W TaxID=2800796 RepID=UPI0028FCFEF1|nr:RICIN domain-containing protein [Actinomyces sp. MRS3W]MDU0348748.1 RICIN domain-containing protein [Actinomyces sp. MRS3W]